MAQPNFFVEGHSPRRSDTQWKIEQKILGALNDSTGGGTVPTGGGFVTQGSGPPAAPPSSASVAWIHTDTDTGTLYTWNVGTQSWI